MQFWLTLNPLRAAPAAGSRTACRCSSGPTLHMLALPSDVQLVIAAHLAHEAGGLACCMSVAAIASLSCASRACCDLVSEARAWEQVGFPLGLASPLHARAVPLPELCRAACLGHRLCRSNAVEPCAGMHVSLLPRGRGWARQLFEALHPLGLCAVADAADVAQGLALPSAPLVRRVRVRVRVRLTVLGLGLGLGLGLRNPNPNTNRNPKPTLTLALNLTSTRCWCRATRAAPPRTFSSGRPTSSR
jgi:hypothetical protein